MLINYYFDDNGYFIRKGFANPGSQPPRDATRQCIPDCPAGYIPKRVNGAWTLEETNHGKQAWKTDTAMPVTIKQHGQIPAGLTLLAPPEYPVWNPATNEWDIDLIAKEQDIRAKRDSLLKDTDWTQLADCPLSSEDIVVWQDYRQALRDIPQQAGFPASIIWPEPPAAW
ncbi:protein of unknown function [Pseudodesulfovibrio profundus]|uniref:Phage tail assembly chaperone-like domain-containing protein n=1 Tax=Pseudodesulfovibrio profundus TaxID=57320 RepID=A0A2C8FDI9_9BACT|nr:tail fiber assembly protein [Pseudodesulfovibrio profundus]SOB60525.1 protein of unknown function [Pseudodesulfovibrio profundus]